MTNLPADQYASSNTRTQGEMKTYFNQIQDFIKQGLGNNNIVALQIPTSGSNRGIIIPTQALHSLTTVNNVNVTLTQAQRTNLPLGSVLVLQCNTTGTLTIEHSPNTPNGFSLDAGNDLVLDNGHFINLIQIGTIWFEFSNSAKGKFLGYEEIFTTDNNKEIMAGASSAFVELYGAGGGGASSGALQIITGTNWFVSKILTSNPGGDGGNSTIIGTNLSLTALGGFGGVANNVKVAGRQTRNIFQGVPGGEAGTTSINYYYRKGDNGSAGDIKSAIITSDKFPLNITIGTGGIGGIATPARSGFFPDNPGAAGGDGLCKIKYFS